MDRETWGRIVASLPDDFQRHYEMGVGRMVFHGYYRLLGREGTWPYTLEGWNEADCWRFAWPSLPREYVCVGFSAWGDHYVLNAGDPSSGVLLLDAYEMSEERLGESFTGFISGELARLDRAPYDERVSAAFDRFGALGWNEGLALVPPLLLSDSEDACQVVKTNMRSLMIANGDVFTQLQELPEGNAIERVTTFQDEQGRERLRVVPVSSDGMAPRYR